MSSKHKHDWVVAGWGDREPNGTDDIEYYWHFNVLLRCSCGAEKNREATGSEVRDRIESRRCSGCGLMDRKHDSRDDCIRELFERVCALEGRLDRIGESFSR